MSAGQGPGPPRRPRVIEAILVALAVSALGLGVQMSADSRGLRSCRSNLQQVGIAMLQYNRDYDEMYPLANWQEALLPYSKSSKVFYCPQSGAPFAMQQAFVGRQMNEIGGIRAPMLFESTLNGPNALDDGAHWPAVGVHREGLWKPRGSHWAAFDGRVWFSLSKPDFRLTLRPRRMRKYLQP